MRCWQVLGVTALAACAAEAVPEPDAAGIERACAAVVADHVGKPVEAVTARLGPAGEAGLPVVVVTDASGAGGERTHTCEIDAAGRVLAIRHPGA